MYMKKEYELILKAVLINKSEQEKKDINVMLQDELDWGLIAGILFNHRLTGYFYKGLDENQQKRIPKELRKTIVLLIQAQKFQQEKMFKQYMIINDRLLKNNIRFAALKGAVFCSDMYELGARRSNDLDLFVYENDLEDLDKVLCELGFSQGHMEKGELVKATKREKIIQRMNYHDLIPYVKIVDEGYLELDINFLFDGKENEIDDKIVKYGTKLVKGKNYDVVSFDTYINLAHLCTHFYREATNSIWTETNRDVTLYKIVDIMNFIRYKIDEIDEEKFINVLNELNLSDKAYYTFRIMSEFYEDKFILNMLYRLKPKNEEYINQIYDSKNKKIVQRKKSFFESAFCCVR